MSRKQAGTTGDRTRNVKNSSEVVKIVGQSKGKMLQTIAERKCHHPQVLAEARCQGLNGSVMRLDNLACLDLINSAGQAEMVKFYKYLTKFIKRLY